MSTWLARLKTPAPAGVLLGAALLLMLLLLGGCATQQVSSLQQRLPAEIPLTAAIESVPFFPQTEYQCGPAALAMVAQNAGVKVSPEELTSQVFVPGRKGSFQVEMLAAARRQGLLAYPLAPELEDLLKEVAAGNPVLVLQNLTFSFAPLWHYAVVIAFDRGRNTITLHSGVTERLEMSLFTFERTWARGQRWSMVALRPDRLPATARAGAYITAAAALERAKPDAAQAAYGTALKAWPRDRTALLGVGNAAYALGRLGEAEAAFDAAARQHPDFADAWNNLAQVQQERGSLRQAELSVAKAVALGGPRLERYLALQAKIKAALQI